MNFGLKAFFIAIYMLVYYTYTTMMHKERIKNGRVNSSKESKKDI